MLLMATVFKVLIFLRVLREYGKLLIKFLLLSLLTMLYSPCIFDLQRRNMEAVYPDYLFELACEMFNCETWEVDVPKLEAAEQEYEEAIERSYEED